YWTSLAKMSINPEVPTEHHPTCAAGDKAGTPQLSQHNIHETAQFKHTTLPGPADQRREHSQLQHQV
ncbi:hypothetical protein ACQP3D_28685, partial [Escherichia coli]